MIKMSLSAMLLLLGITVIGCGFHEKTPSVPVQLVVPIGFKGMIELTQDKTNGLTPSIQNQKAVIVVSQTGKVVLKNWELFFRDHEEFASYADGTAIPDPNMVRVGQSFPTNRIGFWTLGTAQGTGYPQETILRFIGTKAELDNSK